ncbi:MAG: hypothetical protein AAF485_10090, partial [Chloroflexota bacterium]
ITMGNQLNGSFALNRKRSFVRQHLTLPDDLSLDKWFWVETRPETFVHDLFASPDLHQQLLACRPLVFKVSALGLLFEKAGIIAEIDELQTILEFCYQIANQVEPLKG